jgi:hypothetical protein
VKPDAAAARRRARLPYGGASTLAPRAQPPCHEMFYPGEASAPTTPAREPTATGETTPTRETAAAKTAATEAAGAA